MRAASLSLTLLLAACRGAAPVAAVWLGASPHLVADGQVNGEPLHIVIDDPSQLRCRRYYEAPLSSGTTIWADGRLFRFELVAALGNRTLVLGVSPKAFPRDGAPTTLALVPPDQQVLVAGEALLSWAWEHDLDGESTYEATAEGGTVAVELFSGTPDASGLVIPADTGSVGALMTAFWNVADEVTVSFTAPCGANQVQRIIEGRF